MTDTTPFDPIAFNFVKLTDFEFFGGIAVYEIKNHRAVNGAHDFCRLNLYLSKHEDFVTIWWGLLEAMLTEAKFENVALPADFDFYLQREAFQRLHRDERRCSSRPACIACDLIQLSATSDLERGR